MALEDSYSDHRLAESLTNNGGRWDVTFDVPVGDDLVDAVLVGPRGVMAVTSADTASRATIQGRSLYSDQEVRSDLVRMSWVRAHRLSSRLGATVDPVLCLLSDQDLFGFLGTLAIVSPDRLGDLLKHATATHSLGELGTIKAQLASLL